MSTRIRTGKIARLPENIRGQLNRRLQDGEQGKDLVAWLNSLPEVQAVLKTHFGGRDINQQNLSDWTRGGFSEWQSRRETVEVFRRIMSVSDQLTEVNDRPMADLLMKELALRYAVVAVRLNLYTKKGELNFPLLHKCGPRCHGVTPA